MRYDKVNRKIAALEEKVAALTAENKTLQDEHAKIKQVLDSTLHEVRRFSTEISADAERLSKLLEGSGEEIRNLADTILYTSGMVSSRLGFTDLELNPKAVSLQQTYRSGIYKKFEKATHILALRSNAKGLQIKMNGKSFMLIEALPAFELVPFVVLENAIKYSPNGQAITVSFNEKGNRLHVVVGSIGPLVEKAELAKIFDRGFRGTNAAKLSVAGDGLGLYLAKFLCDYHDVSLTPYSGPNVSYTINNIPYARFEMHMDIGISP